MDGTGVGARSTSRGFAASSEEPVWNEAPRPKWPHQAPLRAIDYVLGGVRRRRRHTRDDMCGENSQSYPITGGTVVAGQVRLSLFDAADPCDADASAIQAFGVSMMRPSATSCPGLAITIG